MTSFAFQNYFANKDIKIIFATAPTGLGHIRVTEALKKELGESIKTETIGILNPASQFLHRVMSRSTSLRFVMEIFQSNTILEKVASSIYRKRLRTGNRSVRKYLVNLIEMDAKKPKTVLVVATHFGLAHQIASIRKKVERLAEVHLILAVVVTDDSPQKMWAVDGADFIFVPSAFCARGIRKHLGSRVGGTKIIVSSYPISKEFSEMLSETDYKKRLNQTDPGPGEKLQIVIPVSGAAVQLSYFQNLTTQLRKKKDVTFTMISRQSPYTKDFLHWCRRQEHIQVVSSKSDHEVVMLYEREIHDHIFAVEITKPSEQTFKALLTPKMQGGVLLLFSRPVGRQEYDNVNFLKRHRLIPNAREMFRLNALWYLNRKELIDYEFLQHARNWRGILLPRNGAQSADAITKLYETGILHAMAKFRGFPESSELKSDSAREFWEKLSQEIKLTNSL